jgi:hypothetical protein
MADDKTPITAEAMGSDGLVSDLSVARNEVIKKGLLYAPERAGSPSPSRPSLGAEDCCKQFRVTR